MKFMIYNLNDKEKERIVEATEVATSIPLIDVIKDYIVESVWAYTKDIDIVDPFFNIRSKKLYDIVDPSSCIGWSVKGLQKQFQPNSNFELVIQRADIFKKHNELGFEKLDINTPPAILGEALLKHWQDKVDGDAILQNVTSKRVFILLKTPDNTHYGAIEEDIKVLTTDELIWQWSTEAKIGLHGVRKEDNSCVYKWYPNQKQFFETFLIPNNIFTFDINLNRYSMEQLIDLLKR